MHHPLNTTGGHKAAEPKLSPGTVTPWIQYFLKWTSWIETTLTQLLVHRIQRDTCRRELNDLRGGDGML